MRPYERCGNVNVVIIHVYLRFCMKQTNYPINVSRRGKRDLKSEKQNGSKTYLYQIVHTTEGVFLIVELAITRSKMGLET